MPPRRQGAPPSYGVQSGGTHPFFAHGQPLYPGSFRPPFAAIILIPLLITPMGMTGMMWLATTGEQAALTRKELDNYHWYGPVIRVLDVVAALVSIPLVSMLLSRAAVACTQRSSRDQTLSLSQLAALANRNWLTLTLPFTYLSPFSVAASLLIVLTFINIPLRGVLVPFESRPTLICEGQTSWQGMPARKWYPSCGNQTTIAWEPIPAEPNYEDGFLGTARAADDPDPIVQAIVRGLETVRRMEYSNYGDGRPARLPFWPDTHTWESSVSPETNTGLIRQHALRYNSSATCEAIHPEDFPRQCNDEGSGSAAFASSFVAEGLSLRVCVPFDGSKRFEMNRDAQEITEYMYLSARAPARDREDDDWDEYDDRGYLYDGYDDHDLGNATTRCTATTTRGYFELGSDHSRGVPSDILKEWPSDEDMHAHFSDYGTFSSLLTREVDGYSVAGGQVGPMLRIAQAFFGPDSYFSRVTELYNISRATTTPRALTRLNVPLHDYDFIYADQITRSDYRRLEVSQSFQQPRLMYSVTELPRRAFADAALSLINGFARPDIGSIALSAALHVANEAFLTSLRDVGHPHREIARYRGDNALLPRGSLGTFLVAVILLCIQVVLIVALCVYINFKPTWTKSLDALALMKLGAHLQGRLEFPPLGKTTYAEDVKFLRNADGLIGLVTHEHHISATGDVELANMPRQPQQAAVPLGDRETTRQTTEPIHPPPLYVEDTDADANSVDERPRHRRVSLSSIGPAAEPPPSYYGSEVTTEEVPKGPYTIAVGGRGILDRGLWQRHRPT